MSRYTDAYEEMFHPKKPAKNPNIWCYKCKKESGWTDSDLIVLKGHYALKCQHCKENCIKVMSNLPNNG